MRPNIRTAAGYFACLILIGGCTAFQIAGDVQQGRYALRANQPDNAVGHFSRAAALDPDFVLPTMLSESVQTYLGRAYYEAGNFAEARRTLEIARQKGGQIGAAQLYLGLTSLRQGNRDQGQRDTETGLREIFNTIESIAAGNTDSARYWDASKRIRGEIQYALALSSTGKLPPADLITIGEWVGKNLDEEVEKAQADELRDIQRRGRDN
jgi:tetratricopeptide (TPR) repeat protein